MGPDSERMELIRDAMEEALGLTEEQITALESNGVLGTDEAYIAIGSIMRNDEQAEASRKSLLAKTQ